MPCREGKLSGGAFFIALDINHWFGDPILILVDIPIGKPDETIVLEDVNVQGDTTYYRDAQDVHHVPKRTTRELIINGE